MLLTTNYSSIVSKLEPVDWDERRARIIMMMIIIIIIIIIIITTTTTATTATTARHTVWKMRY